MLPRSIKPKKIKDPPAFNDWYEAIDVAAGGRQL